MTTPIAVRRYTHHDAPRIRQTLIDLFVEATGEEEMADPFNQRFDWFVDHWSGHPEFACVIGYEDDEPVGMAYGAPANPGREWWREHLDPAPEKSRTFSVSELRVRPKWHKTGAAKRIFDALVNGRDEDLAVLLVEVGHPRVQALYEKWGYRKVGERQPFPDSPVYAVMLRALT
ncbi:GNAT family N-acetyltransferase [Streptomyces albireticuli]|uniref:GNAT family N-acetyltransferase n=1 Tax=Streptomyces albireticuli TaxID=1940 RepID=UPI00369E22B9